MARMISFSLFNIPVRVLPWFWITLALISGQIFLDSKEAVMRLLLFMVAGFISVLVHELGHALTAKHFGKQVQIVLQAFGGYAAYSGGAPLSRTQTFMITAAGPAIQILLGVVVWIVLRSLDSASPQAAYFLTVLVLISFVWAILNLLPVLPLDGGRLLETVLGPSKIQLTLKICIGVAVAVAFFSFTLGLGILLPVFMGFMAYENYKALKQVTWR